MTGDSEDGRQVQNGGRNQWWRAFSRWRRKYWLTRLLVLLLVFGPVCVGLISGRHMLDRLMRGSFRNMQLASEPRHAWALARHERGVEVLEVQKLLWLALDADRNGIIDGDESRRMEQVGLTVADLGAHPYTPHLRPLVSAAVRLDLIPHSETAARIRRTTWDAAAAESARMFEESHDRIDAELRDAFGWPDYGRWDTWARGIVVFWAWLGRAALYGALFFVVPGLAGLAFPRRRTAAATGMALLMFVLPFTYRATRGYAGLVEPYWWLSWLGHGIVLVTVGYLAGREAERVQRRLRIGIGGAALLLVLVVLIGVTVDWDWITRAALHASEPQRWPVWVSILGTLPLLGTLAVLCTVRTLHREHPSEPEGAG